MSTFTTDFSAHFVNVRLETELLAKTIHERALASFDIVGKLNVLGAERVVQVGEHTKEGGTQMFVIDEQNHGTLLSFGGVRGGFHELCWCCVEACTPELINDALRTGIALKLHSWNFPYNSSRSEQLMQKIRHVIETGEVDVPGLYLAPRLEGDDEVAVFQELAPALDIPIDATPRKLKIASLTPESWWLNCSHYR